jgi:hypothetical protein
MEQFNPKPKQQGMLSEKIKKVAGLIALSMASLTSRPENTKGSLDTTNNTQKLALVKNNPQREAYKNYENYRKYVQLMLNENEEKYKNAKVRGWFDIEKRYTKLATDKEIQIQKNETAIKDIREFAILYLKDPSLYNEIWSTEGKLSMGSGVEKAFQSADEQREWMVKILNSKAYIEKLGIEGLPKQELKRRTNVAIENEPIMSDRFNPMEINNSGIYLNAAAVPVAGKSPGRYTIEAGEQASGTPIEIHELEHAITEQEQGISAYAKKMYQESFVPDPKNKNLNEYFSSPTELDARKKVFEYELEKFGIWKYSEKFTKEHLDKAIQLDQDRKLSQDSSDFLKYMKHGAIPSIMNTIAKDTDSESDKLIVG